MCESTNNSSSNKNGVSRKQKRYRTHQIHNPKRKLYKNESILWEWVKITHTARSWIVKQKKNNKRTKTSIRKSSSSRLSFSLKVVHMCLCWCMCVWRKRPKVLSLWFRFDIFHIILHSRYSGTRRPPFPHSL